jgi:L-serine/L-threonine ammonia-lyase
MSIKKLHVETPLFESVRLSRLVPGQVWLKMEALQPASSFKLRGIGNVCQHYIARGAKKFISSSGGNAGLAVAYSGRKLGLPVTVVVPKSTGSQARAAIEQENGEVIVVGDSWQEAHEYALDLTDETSFYIHPFDNPVIWEGHASMIDEVKEAGIRPDVVVLSVGGGGLLCGVLEGLHRNDWADVPVLAVETEGAASLAACLKAGKHVELENITSIATTLGAKRVASKAWEWCSVHEVISHVVPDLATVESCLRFADDHRVLVEPACGASLAALYNPHGFLQDKRCILVVVCGGAGVSIEQLQRWKAELQ